jgi:hypothetical protein
MTQSEVAHQREQIRLEWDANQRVLTDFTSTARHKYIAKRQENIGAYYEEITRYMPP